MFAPHTTRLGRGWAITSVCIALAVPGRADADGPKEREQIGQVLGEPVYRDEIKTGEDVMLRDELARLFIVPVLEKYRLEHKDDITSTEAEIAVATKVFVERHAARIKDEEEELRSQLAGIEQQLEVQSLTAEQRQALESKQQLLEMQLEPPGRNFALFVLNNWKFQKHLYEHFGGGRILWQQSGLEAFDAMHKWLQAREEAEEFKVDDPALRPVLYEYWTMDHGAFLTDDADRIRTEFLEPEWAPDQTKDQPSEE